MKDSLVVVCFSGDPGDTCDFILNLSLEIAKNNLVFGYLLYSEPFSIWKSLICEQKPWVYSDRGIYFLRPIYVLPLQRFEIIRRINRWLYFRVCFPIVARRVRALYAKPLTEKKYFLFSQPEKEQHYFETIFTYFTIKHYITIFDMVDLPYLATRSNTPLYKQFVRRAYLTTVNSNALFAIFNNGKSRIAIVPQGFSIKDFKGVTRYKAKPSMRKPFIGYVGSLGPRLDHGLLFSLIQRNPQYHFVFWGPSQSFSRNSDQRMKRMIAKLFKFDNVMNGSSKNRKRTASVIAQCDVCTIPYDVSWSFNRHCYPMKLFEYFYMGKPVVSTPIEELKQFPKYIKIGSTVEEWERHIAALLSKPWPKEYREQQRRLATQNTWQKKAEAMSRLSESL